MDITHLRLARRRLEALRIARGRLKQRRQRAKMVSAILPVFAATMAAGFFDPARYAAAIWLILTSALLAAVGYWLVDQRYLVERWRRTEGAYREAVAKLRALEEEA